MRTDGKKIMGVFLVLSGIILSAGCSGGEKSTTSTEKTVIIAKNSDNGNQPEEYYLGANQEADSNVNININRLGYRKQDEKIAVVRNYSGQSKFDVLSEEGKVVYSGYLETAQMSSMYDEAIYYADFSDLKKEGTYYIMCGDDAASPIFDINNHVYQELERLAARPFMEKTSVNVKGIVIETQKKQNVSGGWYIDSDNSRYVVTSTVALANLWNLKDYYKKSKLIVKNGKTEETIDVAKQCKEEVRWLLKMQDMTSGGVYHKVSINGEGTEQTPYISRVSTCATADFAAVMAKASMKYAKEDKNLSNQCIKAAKLAWEYLEAHKDNQVFSNSNGIKSREYSDTSDADERLWAAVELYLATGDEGFLERIEQYMSTTSTIDFGWQNVSGFALFDFYVGEDKKNTSLFEKVNEKLQKEVANSLKGLDSGELINEEYAKEKTQYVINRGVLLSLMEKVDANKKLKYSVGVRHYLDYILGLNERSNNSLSGMTDEKEEQSLDISSALLLMLQNIAK